MNAEINLYWIWLSELLGGDPPAGGPGKEAAQRNVKERQARIRLRFGPVMSLIFDTTARRA